MLGDTAVAIHPDDERYKDLVGKTVALPLTGREIPIITDTFVDPEFGTGCVKVTPAHDPNDFAMGERHDLEFINIMNDDASLNSNVPEKYIGLSRENARKSVVADLESLGLLDKKEDHINNIGFSERGNVPIEFYMSEQWYMKMSDLVKPALEAVKNGKVKFHPGITGPKHMITGWKILETGVSVVNYYGGIRYLFGIIKMIGQMFMFP
ncbi:hypothetical protein Ct9H90mP29_14770 [bacterium]|nr:MAG: hypothetical protein Ct9H90mP29_14770 [bacterium]